MTAVISYWLVAGSYNQLLDVQVNWYTMYHVYIILVLSDTIHQ